ncbi:GNAT family N-acetyltransferase [Rhodoligotrophos ferricapiens]|uniref:GNAT family N-acetyltransferase n=1 Tax=Rhodoligotrophos ferricapiens TaxID=3069264 RepID=UPI00315C6EDB
MSAGKSLAFDAKHRHARADLSASTLAPLVRATSDTTSLRVTCHGDIEALREIWQDFQGRALGTLYETWEWCRAWQECIGAPSGVVPRIVIGRDSQGGIAFLLPLSVRRRMGMNILTWMTAPTLNYGLGLYDPAFLDRHDNDLSHLWPEILNAAGPVDAVHLAAMPAYWDGREHPLHGLFSAQDANCAYVTNLTTDFDGLYAAKRSSASRRSAKKRDARLEREGCVTFGLPETLAETRQIIDALFEQRAGRMGEMGISRGVDAREQQFVYRFAECSKGGPVRLAPFTLKLDSTPLGIALGGIHGGIYYALILSMTEGPMRKHSPGDAVLRRSIEACSKAGLRTFDFGAGHSDYKDAWADEAIPLHAIVAPRSLRGLAYALRAKLAISLKRQIKTSPRLWSLVRQLRRCLAQS